MNFKTISLSNNNKQIIPESVNVLNPEEEGKRPYAYFVWISTLDKDDSVIIDFHDSVRGDGVCYPFLYFTNCKNLWKVAISYSDSSTTPNKKEISEYQDLMHLITKQIYSYPFTHEPFVIACALCDCSGNAVPTGIGPVFQIKQF